MSDITRILDLNSMNLQESISTEHDSLPANSDASHDENTESFTAAIKTSLCMTLVMLVHQDPPITDSVLLKLASVLAGRGYISSGQIKDGLNMTRELLQYPLDETAALTNIGDMCMEKYNQFHHLDLIQVAIECYNRLVDVTPSGAPSEIERKAILGQLYWNRFQRLKNITDVDNSILYLEMATKITDDHDSGAPTIFGILGLAHRGRFEALEETKDIDLAVVYHAKAAALTPDNESPESLAHLTHLGSSHLRRFQKSGNESDLEDAVLLHTQACSWTPDDHPQKGGMLNNLATTHLARFSLLQSAYDLNLALEYYTQAILVTPDGDCNKPGIFLSLGRAHGTRFKLLGKVEDMNKEIESYISALLMTPQEHSDRAEVLETLGKSYFARFEHSGDILDIDKALDCYNSMVSTTSPFQSMHIDGLGYLANLYRTRFRHLGQFSDIDMAVKYDAEALSATSEEHPARGDKLLHLMDSYNLRFETQGNLTDLDGAIACASEGLSISSAGDEFKASWLCNLGSFLGSRVEILGELGDLERAMECHEQAVRLTPNDHPKMPLMLISLAGTHERRFARLGKIADIDKAVTYFSQAVPMLPHDHQSKPIALTNLGLSYLARYSYLELLFDNDMAISTFQEALSLSSTDSDHRPAVLRDLGLSYSDRFNHLHILADIDVSINFHTQAVSLTPENHPRKPQRLDSLASSFKFRFDHTSELVDLSEAIGIQRQAVNLALGKDIRSSLRLGNLGAYYCTRFMLTENAMDIDNSIIHLNEALLCIPSGDTRRAGFLGNLARSHDVRFQAYHQEHDIESAIAYCMQGCQYPSGEPHIRLQMAQQWAVLSFIHQSSSVLDACQEVMRLIPQTIWLGSTTERRYEQLAHMGKANFAVVQIAVLLEKNNLALEWLEQGRSIVWNQLLELRVPLDELQSINPTLAREIKETSKKLADILTLENTRLSTYSEQLTLEQTQQEHRRLAEKWEKLTQKAQATSGLNSFMRPKTIDDLTSACRNTTVVVVLVCPSASFALTIGERDRAIGLVQLREFTEDKATVARTQMKELLYVEGRSSRGVKTGKTKKLELTQILYMLWLDVAKPIIDSLGYTDALQTSQLPHVTWCLTGPLAFLPLHAAGDYNIPGAPTLFDYVISSYTPNISSLLVPEADHATFSGIATISQESTLGLSPLPGTGAEIDGIISLINGSMQFTRLEGEDATSSAVLAAMEKHSWVHLACHANQDAKRPTDSAFHLHGGPLSLAAITQKHLKHADLAFLSACQTATGDHDLPEEAVHLAAGMIMAGYRRVIATIWSIDDRDAPLVAERFYAYMLDETMPKKNKAARALHHAVECLRRKCGAKEAARWAAYIHIGL